MRGDPESFMDQEREEQRFAHAHAGRDPLTGLYPPGDDRPSRAELRREARELEEDLRARRGGRR